MKSYVDEVCIRTERSSFVVEIERISPPLGYRDGAVVAPLGFEPDEFCGLWFVQFGIAFKQRFAVHRLDLGQARFRFQGAYDVQYPGAIRKNEAEVKRDELIEALDQRFGPDQVNTAARSVEDAVRIWQQLWPCRKFTGK